MPFIFVTAALCGHAEPFSAVAHVWSHGPMSTPTLDSEAETQREQAAFPVTELPRDGARF